jgi:hypothetical protein
MGGDQLPDKFNFLGANLAAPVNKLALHDRQLKRSKMERKWDCGFFALARGLIQAAGAIGRHIGAAWAWLGLPFQISNWS